jgi:hypothetical protein
MVWRHPRPQNRGGKGSRNESPSRGRLVRQTPTADSRTSATDPSFPEEAATLIESMFFDSRASRNQRQ